LRRFGSAVLFRLLMMIAESLRARLSKLNRGTQGNLPSDLPDSLRRAVGMSAGRGAARLVRSSGKTGRDIYSPGRSVSQARDLKPSFFFSPLAPCGRGDGGEGLRLPGCERREHGAAATNPVIRIPERTVDTAKCEEATST
jgi:hypothetical protein